MCYKQVYWEVYWTVERGRMESPKGQGNFCNLYKTLVIRKNAERWRYE